MATSDAGSSRKTYVVDTSILVSAPDALQNLTSHNTVLVPFPVLQELDRKRTSANGVGYTARNTIKFLDEIQSAAPPDQLRSGIPLNGGLLKFHSGTLDLTRAWPGFNPGYADDAIILLADEYQQGHPAEAVILVTRDAAMRCKARARSVSAEDYWSDRPVASPEKFYSGRVRIDVPQEHAGLLSTLHHEQRLPADALGTLCDVTRLLANQCCELHVSGNGKTAWGIYKSHDGSGYLRRVNTKPGERFGPCTPEQACARDLILDDQSLIVSLVGIAGTGKTLIALLAAYEMLRSGRVSRIEVYRLNAEAGRELGFLPGDLDEKMAPWAKPVIDNLDFVMRRLHGSTRFSNQVADHHGERRDLPHPTVENLLQSKLLEIAPINYLRGRSIHDAAIVVDDGQNLTQEDMKLVLTRAGEGSRVILTGDPDQIDRAEINALSNGLVQVVERFKGQPNFAHLSMHDVVRSRIAEMAAKLL
ncbi:MAG TPA: PhoH family protein [Vicinamibacterales bacterium]|mgnify:CR=1 FL=1|nr:PhoH family protein [Vicinamibacterales bacterium]